MSFLSRRAPADDLFTEDFSESAYWWRDAAPQEGLGADRLGDADAVVIGSGYAGLNAALTLAERGVGVTLLEAGRLGEGASTLNGGQMHAEPRVGAAALTRRYGPEIATEILEDFEAASRFVRDRLAALGIDCAFEWNGTFVGAHTAKRLAEMARTVESAPTREREHLRLLRGWEVAREVATDLYRGGLVDLRGGQLHPALYHAGLLSAARAAGVKLFAHQRVEAIARHRSGGFTLRLAAGARRAERVVVATNGYTGAFAPWLRRRLVPLRSYMIATEELPEAEIRALVPGDRALSDTKRVLYYFRTSPDRRRILFGGRASFRDTDARAAARVLHGFLGQVFPALRRTRIAHAWFGNVAFSFDFLPHVHHDAGLVHVGGCCGSGVLMMSYLGDRAARLVLGEPPRGLARTVPPAPPLYAGSPWFLPAVGSAYRLMDRLDTWVDRPGKPA